ncbi:MAG: DUF3127 domain-containing protein [Prevotella sp.]|nr:DUF3127 domain-containing protein [Prevotella sp.]MDT3387797.1 DUF3127 domain-containing protein [Bacteroidota bacterium]
MIRRKFRILNVGEIRRGHSERTNQDWQAQEVVLEELTDETPYPESFTTSLQGNDVKLDLRAGDRIECSSFMRVRQYNDHFYNEVRVRNVTHLMRHEEARPFGYPD